MTDPISDARLEAALAKALGPLADDTAPLSRSVLSRIAQDSPPSRPALAEVLVTPLPMTGLLLAGLLFAGAIGHIFISADLTEAFAVIWLLGSGI